MTEYETQEIWLFSHSTQDAVPHTAMYVNGEWHYVTDTGIHPLYREIMPEMLSRQACLEAELKRERTSLARSQEKCRQIEGKLAKLGPADVASQILAE